MCFVLFVGVNSVWNLNSVRINTGDIKADSFHSITHLPGCLFVSLLEDLMQLLLALWHLKLRRLILPLNTKYLRSCAWMGNDSEVCPVGLKSALRRLRTRGWCYVRR